MPSPQPSPTLRAGEGEDKGTLLRFKSLLSASLLLALLLVCLSSRVFSFNQHHPFDISADMIEYVDGDQSMTAEGHVVVTQGTSTLKSDYMRYERVERRLFARGHVVLNDNGAVLLGDTLDYDLVSQKGTVTNALGYQAPWIFSGENWQKEMDYYIGRQVSMTSCDLPDPHYRFRSQSVHLVPDSHFWAWNNVAYADNIPVFYSPFLYKNLAQQRVVIQFQPGHDQVNGNFVKTLTTVRITDLIYDKVYVDLYSEQGTGLGNEFNYSDPGRMRGSLFGYYIDPHGQNSQLLGAPEEPQYSIRSYHWQKLDGVHTLQSNVNLRKNVSFNNQYFAQDTNQSVNDITSSIALTRQKGRLNQRVVVERQDAPDPGDTDPFAETHVQTASLPRYEVTLYQIPILNLPDAPVDISSATLTPGTTFVLPRTSLPERRFGPIMLNANGTLGNTYQRLDEEMHLNGQGSLTLSESIPLSRMWSFTPSVSPQLTWQDRFNAQPRPPAGSTVPVSTVGLFRGFQGRLGTADTLRWRPLSALTLDQTYSLTARMEPNSTGLDDQPADGGIETHHINWLAFWRPSRSILMRSFSGYDMRDIADESLETYHQRKWDPWTTEFSVDPTRNTEYFFRYSLGYYPFRDQSWQTSYRFSGLYKTLLETGVLYNRGTPGQVTWNNSIGVYLSPGWRFDATFHALVPSTSLDQALRAGKLIDENLIVTRDLHCWQAQFVYRHISGLTRTYSFLFNLKLGVKAKEAITNDDLETQYYPWRAKTYAP